MFSIERSGYYAWINRKPSKQSIANELLDKKIIDIFSKHKSRYGYPRITDEWHDQGEKCGKIGYFAGCDLSDCELKQRKNLK